MTGFNGIMGSVHEYLKKFPGTVIAAGELERALGLRDGQSHNALSRLLEYPHAGVRRVRRGLYCYEPIKVSQTTPAPEQRDAMAAERAAAQGFNPIPESKPNVSEIQHEGNGGGNWAVNTFGAEMVCAGSGHLYEVAVKDKDGFMILEDEDGNREFVLVRRTLLKVLLEQSRQNGQVRAFRKALRALVQGED